MVGERRKKRPAASRGSRPGSRKGARGGASRSTPTGSRERRKKSSKARVIQFPQGRQPKHSKTLGRRKSGSGRFRLIVAAVVVVCVLLSLEGRAVQFCGARSHSFGRRPVPRGQFGYREGDRDPISGERAEGGGRSAGRGAQRRRWNHRRDRGEAHREER